MKEAVAAPGAVGLTLNFCTPHTPVYKNKTVEKVMLPGEIGEYGITAGHSPLISQLKSGVVTVQHVDVSCFPVIIEMSILRLFSDHRATWKSFLCPAALLFLTLTL